MANWYKGSTISRDMLIGLAWYAFYNKRLDISEDIISHSLKNFGKMGEGDPTRIFMSPSLLALFALVSKNLGGPKRHWLTWIPSQTPKHIGFEAHLQVLQVLLRKQIKGSFTKAEADILDWQYNRSPQNPLFAIASGKLSEAEVILANTALWPDQRLPTTHDRSEDYLPQRDLGKDWAPDTREPAVSHTGTDYLFCYALIKNILK